MKKILISLFFVLASCCFSSATAVTKTVTLNYEQSQFSFSFDSLGYLRIVPHDCVYVYDKNTDVPGLPYLSVAVYVPSDQLYQNCKLFYEKSLIFEDCVIAPAPILQPTSMTTSEIPQKSSYSNAIYPVDGVSFTGESVVGDFKVLYFTVCPFAYDKANKKLYLAENIKLDIDLKKNPNTKAQFSNPPVGLGMPEYLKLLVINQNDFNFATDTLFSTDYLPNKLDYVIITNNDLADSFIPLRNWKRQKGVWTEIVTVESIDQKYEGKSLQEKIKSCLFDLYKNRYLKYVLLGGDDTIVPVMYCRNTCLLPSGDVLPTDMYYSCFGKTFDWDYNKNGVYGEPDDSIDLMPNVYLSRLPIRTANETNIYTDRLISYEKMKNPELWNNKMLFCGYKLSDILNNGHSDAECMGIRLYNEVISKYWNGDRKRLSDTYNDFGYNRVCSMAIQEQLSTGYAFADFISHGAPWCYNLSSDGHYDNNDAAEQTNTGYTMITTTACCTNAFDDCDLKGGYGDPCLSESLIRNEKSGVLSYLGCSREGFHFRGFADGPTLQYEMKYYENLFGDKYKNKNYAKLVAYSKASFASVCNGDNEYRWIQFCLNPVGDAEMPVFTDMPKKLPSANIDIRNGNLYVKTEIDSCTICAMSRLDNGLSYYKAFHNVNNVCFPNIVDSLTLCISKQNYIPQIIGDVDFYNKLLHPASGTIIGAGKDLPGGDLVIEYNVPNTASAANIVVSPYDGSPSKSYPVTAGDNKLRLSSGLFRKGVLAILLFVNSKLADNINIDNK